MGIYVPWLADAARLTGYPVVELSGWLSRGHGGMTSVEGVVCHHTAGPRTGEYPSLRVVRDGRAGLAGPLAHFGLGRSGTVYVNAAGTAWHAGTSEWAGISNLNGRFLGIEAEDDGDGVWTAAQLDCYPRLAAALCHYMRRAASRVCSHRECATEPRGRKPDPTGIDMVAFRRTTAGYLTDPLRLIPRGGPAAPVPAARPTADPVEDDDMTPDQALKLDLLFAQVCKGDAPGDKWGWGTWPGGTNEALTLIDYARRNNVEVRQLHANLLSVHQKLDELSALVRAAGADPAVVTAAIAEALGGGLQITGTAVPQRKA